MELKDNMIQYIINDMPVNEWKKLEGKNKDIWIQTIKDLIDAGHYNLSFSNDCEYFINRKIELKPKKLQK